MPCYKPLQAWRGIRDRNIYFRRINDCDEITLPCGQCIGCRLERSRQWAVRCMHEAKLHKHNAFITLTYNEQNNPGTLIHRDFVLFAKRLRKLCSRGAAAPLHGPSAHLLSRKQYYRYYMAGEYGNKHRRPHYHACIFGIDFADKKYLAKSPTGAKLYRSPTLEKLWPMGFSSIGEVNFETAAYVARYVMKKITGDAAIRHYEIIDSETGEIKKLKPEYNNMSRRPGIAYDWLKKYTPDVYPQGQVIVRGRPTNSPRYYDKLYKKIDPLGFAELKEIREQEAIGNWIEQTHERLQVREAVARAKISHLKRKI